MTKLKTLKDIDWDEPHLMVEELRQEAIKEIKILMTDMKTSSDLLWEKWTGNTITYSKEDRQVLIRYIKWKNNITKEDLE